MQDDQRHVERSVLAKCEGPDKDYSLEMYVKDGYYHVEGMAKARIFHKFYKNADLAWKCYYDKWRAYEKE